MEQALFNSNMYLCISCIFLYLLIAILMAWFYKIVSPKWRYHNLLWRPFGSKTATYWSGVLIWIAMSVAITQFIFMYSSVSQRFEISRLHLLFVIPFTGLIVYLIWNLMLSLEKSRKGQDDSYEQEVELIKFVERHANYLILGITGVFIAAQFWVSTLNEPAPHFEIFYLFMILSLMFSVCGVLPLVWSPKGHHEHLEWLRNYKTVWYGYSIYLFLAGIIAFAIAIL